MKDLPVLAIEPPFVLDRHQVAYHHLLHDDENDEDDKNGENATTFPMMKMMRMMRMPPPSYDISGCVSAVSPGEEEQL